MASTSGWTVNRTVMLESMWEMSENTLEMRESKTVSQDCMSVTLESNWAMSENILVTKANMLAKPENTVGN